MKANTVSPRRQRRKKSALGIFFKILSGWLCLLIVMGLATARIVQLEQRKEAVRAKTQKQIANIQDNFEKQKAELNRRQLELKEQFTTLNNKYLELYRKQHSATVESRELVAELEQLSSKKAALKNRVESLQTTQEVVGEGLTDIEKRARDLEKRRRELLRIFRAEYSAKKEDLKHRVEQGDPVAIRGFFNQNRNTAFGPAACFFAAEAYVKKEDKVRSLQLYKTLTRLYPDTNYASLAEKRVAALEEGDLPTLSSVDFTPYKIDESMDIGRW